MTLQRALLRSMSLPVIGRVGRSLLRDHCWTIEAGEAAGLRLYLPQNHDYVLGSSEVPVQAALRQLISPGDVVYDIGANIGFFTLIAARRVGPTGRVVAFEPVAENASSIRRNLAANRFRHVDVYEIAVGDRAGREDMLLTAWDGGGSLSHEAIRPGEATSTRSVEVSTLDQLVLDHGLRPPTLVKIDVEGHEEAVLRGMNEILRKHRPGVLFEVDDADERALERRWNLLDGVLTSSGYEVEHLPNAYPNRGWFVGHTLARPRPLR